MSLSLRLAIGPVVVCDLLLFTTDTDDTDKPPAELAGGQGTFVDQKDPEDAEAIGFRRLVRRPDKEHL